MKRIFLILPALCMTMLFSCEPDRRTAQSDGYEDNGLNEGSELANEEFVTTDMENTSAAGALEEEAREFVNEAASSSMLEVELGQLAQEKAQSQEVKDFAQMMVNDHRQVNENLQAVAQGKNVEIPQILKEDHQDKMENLREKSGQEFDKEYMSIIVDMHEKDIDKFESMRDEVQDPELQSWIDNTLASMRQHREEAERIKEQVENQQ